MPQLNYREYYVARAEASRTRARDAIDEQISEIYSQSACRYDLLADEVKSGDGSTRW